MCGLSNAERHGSHYSTDDFIDDTLVGVEVEGEAGVAGEQIMKKMCGFTAMYTLFFNEDAGSTLGGFGSDAALGTVSSNTPATATRHSPS